MKYYTEDHIWVEIKGDEATLGISEYAAEEYGEIEYVELPVEDDDVILGDNIGTLETKDRNVSIFSPLSGTISTVNEELEADPELITDSPEDKGWLCKMTDVDESELDDLMDGVSYKRFLRSQGKY